MTDADHILTQLFRKWKHRKWLSLCLQSLAIGILIAALGHITFDLPMGVTATGISLGLGLVQLYRFQSKGAKMQELAHYLNQKHPELEQSADLLLQEEAALNRLTRLQQQKIKEKLAGLDLELPNPAPVQVLLLIICISLSAAMSLIPFSKKEENRIAEKNQPTLAEQSIKEKSKAIPVLKEAFISINPPDYTRLKTIRQNDFNITAPYFSTITWNLDFSSTPESVELMLGSGEKLILQPDHEGLHFAKKRIEKNDFYTIKWKGLTDEWSVSDYFQIKVLPDKSPEIEVTNLEAYSSFPYEPEREILLQATVRDDYGISDARIVATVSKGEGESVKFRDDTLHFDQGFRRQLKQYQLQKRLKLEEFNMEPGDELYLHFEASDNRQPLVQTTKTFKYIIALEDSSKIAMEMFGGLAVDRMPEYFRSQRQIIIDTEKLIARRKQLKPKTFNEQSNNIGIDQKVLRLRYGKFLEPAQPRKKMNTRKKTTITTRGLNTTMITVLQLKSRYRNMNMKLCLKELKMMRKKSRNWNPMLIFTTSVRRSLITMPQQVPNCGLR